ncbi:MAG: LamG-like jellyroll fold domain-containing protein [Verrucomicrobiota bacterium]
MTHNPSASFAIRLLLAGLMILAFAPRASAQTFVHPGLLHTEADFNRMKAKVDLGAQPWLSGWQALTSHGYSQLGAAPRPLATVIRPGNVAQMYIDIYRTYQCALRWKVSGDTNYADQAVTFLNAWSSTMTGLTGNADRFLAAGIHGYQWANAGEIMRTYPGWAPADMARFQNLLVTIFYPMNHDFLVNHNGAAITNYWSNWDLSNIASMQAIGVFCDRADIYNEAMNYIYQGAGNGAIDRAIYNLHAGNLGQMQESGRDQGHTTLSISLLGAICEMGWNQGEDLYGYRNNRCLAGAEYVFKYNQWQDVPYVPYMWGTGQSGTWQIQANVSGAARGSYRPIAEMVYNHYVNRLGLAAPFSKEVAEQHRPEGNGGNGDQLGFGTLTFTRDPIAAGANPKLTVAQSAGDVILSWWGSAYAPTYNVKRATNPGGPYVTIAAGVSGDLTTYTDADVAAPGQYYYVVTGVLPSAQETGPSNEVRAAFPAELTTWLKADETSGTTAADSSGKGHIGTLVSGPTWTAGKTGNAISLDGVNDHVSLPPDVVGGLSDFTVATWVYLNSSNTWSRIFDFGGKPGSYMFLTPRSGNGTTRFTFATVYGYNEQRIDGPALPTGQWVHVAVTLSGRVATLYINGVEAGRSLDCFLQPIQLAEGAQNWIGRSQYPNDPYLNGKVDDFRIYQYALGGHDVYALWGQSPNHAPSFTGEHVAKANATEDANYSTTAQTLATSANDPDGNALTFTKLDGPAWLTVAANGALSGTPANADVGPNTFLVRVADPSGAGGVTRLHIDVINTNDAPTWLSDPVVKPSVTRDQPYLTASLAADAADVDGGATLTFSIVAGPAWLSVAADGTLSGTPGTGDVGTNNFTVRVTDDTGLSDDATLAITVLPFQMRAHLAFEDNTNDSLGNFPGTATGTPAYGIGRIGRGMVFDGVDDYVSLPAAAGDSQDISIASWVFWNGGAANQRVFDFGNDTSQYLFLSPSSGGLRFAIKNGGAEQAITSATLATGQWVHLVVTLGGNTATLYANGTAVGTNNAVTINPSDFKPKFNYIGKSQWADPLFNGVIDGFRIYNYAITPAEIAVLMDEVPAVPVGVTATPKTSRIDLTWSASQGAQTYTVKRSLNSGGLYTVVASGLTATTFSNTGLTNGTPYYYVVSATNAKGESADSAQVTAVPSDLLAWWKFNETSGTTAADSSGNGRDGTLTNGPVWAPGLFNGGVGIPAVNNESVTLPTGIVSGLSDFTISGWVKINAFTTFARIFDFGTSTANYMFLTPQYTGTAPNAAKLRFAIRTPSVTEDPAGAALNQVTSTIAMTAGVWTHVAVTLTGTTGRIYVNGTLAGTTTTMTLKPSDLGSTNLNWFGDSQFGGDPTLNGLLDDFRIHSRALSDAEINAAAHPSPQVPNGLTAGAGDTQLPLHWNVANFASSYTLKRATISGGSYEVIASGLTTTSYTDTGLTNDTTYYYVVSASNTFAGESANSSEWVATPTYLRAYLKFDESEGTTAADSSGLGWNATTVNGPVWEEGKSANALAFTGSSSQYATLPTGVIGGLTNTTVMAWVKLNGAPTTWQRVFDFGTGTTNYMFLSTQFGTGGNANKLRFAIRTPSVGEEGINSNTVNPVGAWAHVAVVLSGSTGRLYLNGVQVGVNNAMTLTPSSLGSTTQNYLGKSQWPDPYFNGSIDDFRIHSRAMTTEEVAAFATPLAAPENLEATGGVQQVQLAWDAVPNATTYTVKSSTVSGGPHTPVATGLALPAFTHTGLANGISRYYIVSAENLAGLGPDSAEATAMPESSPITEGEIRTSTLTLSNLTTGGGNLTMAIAASVIGHNYQVQRSPDLTAVSWENVGTAQLGTGGELQIVLPLTLTGDKGFYRILINR